MDCEILLNFSHKVFLIAYDLLFGLLYQILDFIYTNLDKFIYSNEYAKIFYWLTS